MKNMWEEALLVNLDARPVTLLKKVASEGYSMILSKYLCF